MQLFSLTTFRTKVQEHRGKCVFLFQKEKTGGQIPHWRTSWKKLEELFSKRPDFQIICALSMEFGWILCSLLTKVDQCACVCKGYCPVPQKQMRGSPRCDFSLRQQLGITNPLSSYFGPNLTRINLIRISLDSSSNFNQFCMSHACGRYGCCRSKNADSSCSIPKGELIGEKSFVWKSMLNQAHFDFLEKCVCQA